MAARRFLLGLLLLVGIRAGAQDIPATAPSRTWRLSASLATIRFLPLEGSGTDLWRRDTTQLKRAFHPFRWGDDREVIEGRRSMVLPGVFVRNAAETEVGVWVGWNSVRYAEEDVRPRGFSTSHWFTRIEYTRSTRPKARPQRPRLGFRYGCALTVGDGTTDFSHRWTNINGNGQFTGLLSSSLVLLQPTVWFGYRSKHMNAGFQCYWNLAAWARSESRSAGWSRFGLEVSEFDTRSEFNSFVLVDRLTQQGLLWSHFQFVVSVPLIRLGQDGSGT